MSGPLPRLPGLVAGVAIVLLAAGCASSSRSPRRDVPTAAAADRADAVADAEPRLEPIRSGGPNKPYQVLGRDYLPMTTDRPFSERGLASWYGGKFHGAPTASGEIYDMHAMTAAHPTLPIPSYARIRNPANGREIIVRVNDRGPFHEGRIVDLSHAAAKKLDLLRGVAPVELERITFAAIRSGAWRRGAAEVAAAAPTTSSPASEIRLEPPTAAAPTPASLGPGPIALPPAGFWIQFGAFRDAAGAAALQRRLGNEAEWLGPRLATFVEGELARVQAGPFASRGQALDAAGRLRDVLGSPPLIVERR